MRIRLPQMIQDPDISVLDIGRVVEDWTQLDEDHYLDGPVTPRVAVVDLNPTTEKLERGAVFEPPTQAAAARPLPRRQDRHQVDPFHPGQRVRDRLSDDVHLRAARHARPQGQLGLRRAPAAGRAPGRLACERLLRTSLAQPPVLLVRGEGQDRSHQPVARHRGPRDRPRPDRRDRPGPVRRLRPAVAGAARGDRRPHRHAHGLQQQPAAHGDPQQDRRLHSKIDGLQLDRRGVRPGAGPDRQGRLPQEPDQRRPAQPQRRPGRRTRGARAEPGHQRRPVRADGCPPRAVPDGPGRAAWDQRDVPPPATPCSWPPPSSSGWSCAASTTCRRAR